MADMTYCPHIYFNSIFFIFEKYIEKNFGNIKLNIYKNLFL